jgi:hypothetical protein
MRNVDLLLKIDRLTILCCAHQRGALIVGLLPCNAPHLPLPVAEKILAGGGYVQLIVSFGAIREILKKEIYGADKRNFTGDENKRRVAGLPEGQAGSCEYEKFGL